MVGNYNIRNKFEELNKEKLVFSDFAPKVFGKIRQMFGISNLEF
jgi:hypothetical protein